MRRIWAGLLACALVLGCLVATTGTAHAADKNHVVVVELDDTPGRVPDKTVSTIEALNFGMPMDVVLILANNDATAESIMRTWVAANPGYTDPSGQLKFNTVFMVMNVGNPPEAYWLQFAFFDPDLRGDIDAAKILAPVADIPITEIERVYTTAITRLRDAFNPRNKTYPGSAWTKDQVGDDALERAVTGTNTVAISGEEPEHADQLVESVKALNFGAPMTIQLIFGTGDPADLIDEFLHDHPDFGTADSLSPGHLVLALNDPGRFQLRVPGDENVQRELNNELRSQVDLSKLVPADVAYIVLRSATTMLPPPGQTPPGPSSAPTSENTNATLLAAIGVAALILAGVVVALTLRRRSPRGTQPHAPAWPYPPYQQQPPQQGYQRGGPPTQPWTNQPTQQSQPWTNQPTQQWGGPPPHPGPPPPPPHWPPHDPPSTR